MKLYRLVRKGKTEYEEWTLELLIRASNARRARRIAVEREGEPWGDPSFASCRQVRPEGEEGVIMTSMS